MHRFPIDVGKLTFSNCHGYLLDKVPIAIQSDVAEDVVELQVFDNSFDNPLIPVEDGDMD